MAIRGARGQRRDNIRPAALVLVAIGIASLIQGQSDSQRIADACGSPNPYLVTTRFTAHDESSDLPAIIAFRDTVGHDTSDHVTLANQSQVGSVYGSRLR